MGGDLNLDLDLDLSLDMDLDKLRKYAFGSVAVFGSNNNSSISGV